MKKQIEITVPFYDIDPMRVVWHGNYIKYMEMGRCALLADVGATYDDMAGAGFAFPVVTVNVKYIRPAVFGQSIIITTTYVSNENFLIFKYKITDAKTGEKICLAETKQMAVRLDSGESLFQIPKMFLDKFGGIK